MHGTLRHASQIHLRMPSWSLFDGIGTGVAIVIAGGCSGDTIKSPKRNHKYTRVAGSRIISANATWAHADTFSSYQFIILPFVAAKSSGHRKAPTRRGETRRFTSAVVLNNTCATSRFRHYTILSRHHLRHTLKVPLQNHIEL